MTRDYWDFLHETQDLFGFDISEARDYYRDFKEVFTDGLPATVDDLHAWGELAADLAEEYFPEEEEAEASDEEDEEEGGDLTDDERRGVSDRRDLDRGRDIDEDAIIDEDDYWVYAGEELEVTADLSYEGD